jgi:dTDP-4-amino-4,6-dideoxygalactose transaminase
MVANHGQSVQYYHDVVGVNSRLDSIQAAILDIKLSHLDEYSAARQKVAAAYDAAFANIPDLQTPPRSTESTHVFHQYTLQVKNGKRDSLKAFLQTQKVPAMIYYPVPLYQQKAFGESQNLNLPVTEHLCNTVLSLPIHTEMTEEVQAYIIGAVLGYWSACAD